MINFAPEKNEATRKKNRISVAFIVDTRIDDTAYRPTQTPACSESGY